MKTSSAKETIFCHSCGAKLPMDSSFCGECGTKIKVEEESQSGKEIVLKDSPLGLTKLNVIFNGITARGPGEDGTYGVDVRYAIKNESKSDWESLEISIVLINSENFIIGEYRAKESGIVSGESNDYEASFWNVKGELLGDKPDHCKTLINVKALNSVEHNLGQFKLRSTPYAITNIPGSIICDSINIIGGSLWLREPDDDGDAYLYSKIALQNITVERIPNIKFIVSVSDSDGELLDAGDTGELKPGELLALGGSGYSRSENLMNAVANCSISISQLYAEGSGSGEGMDITASESDKSSEDGKKLAWPMPIGSTDEEDTDTEISSEVVKCGSSFELSIYGRGGEIVVGAITKKQYDYWNSKDSDELDEHLGIDGEDGRVPSDCSLREWSEQDNIAHKNGPEFDTGETRISVSNANGEEIWKAECDSEALNAIGVAVELESSFEIFELKSGYYFCGKAFEKGSFFSATHESEVFDPRKLRFVIRNVNGWSLLESVYYDGEQLDGSNDYSTRTVGSEFFVEESEK